MSQRQFILAWVLAGVVLLFLGGCEDYNRGDGDVEQYIGNFNRYVEPVLRSGGGG